MSLIVVPDDGIGPLVSAVQKAKTSIDIGIFRLDRGDIAKALRMAVARGVPVRTLIAYTNRGGDRRLRKLEQGLWGVPRRTPQPPLRSGESSPTSLRRPAHRTDYTAST